MAIPADRGHLATEHRSASSIALDSLSTSSCVRLMVADHERVQRAVAETADALAEMIDAIVMRMHQGGRLIYLGAGTSGRLGVLDASECPPTFQSQPDQVIGIIAGGDDALRRSSEAKEDDPFGAAAALESLSVGPLDFVLGIAAGGTTPYVIGGVSIARELGSGTGLLTCAKPSEKIVDHLIFLDTGSEILTGSTRLKAGSATKLALNIISTTAFVKLGKVYSNLMVDVRATNDKLMDRAIRIVIELCPNQSRETAATALRTAEGDLKAAIVMTRLDVSLAEARAVLQQSRGSLRVALGSVIEPT